MSGRRSSNQQAAHRPVSSADLGGVFARVRATSAHLPEVEESTWFGTPSLKVRGKSFARMKDAETLVVMCAIDEKEMLMEVDPRVYFETDHYKGWPAVLVRLKKISAPKLRHRLEQAWRLKAPKRLIAKVESGNSEARCPRLLIVLKLFCGMLIFNGEARGPKKERSRPEDR